MFLFINKISKRLINRKVEIFGIYRNHGILFSFFVENDIPSNNSILMEMKNNDRYPFNTPELPFPLLYN